MDMILDPGNRFHMSPEAQLKQLLEKLDMVTSMCASGERAKRMQLLRREIDSVRHNLSRQRCTPQMLSGNIKKEDKREEVGDRIKKFIIQQTIQVLHSFQ